MTACPSPTPALTYVVVNQSTAPEVTPAWLSGLCGAMQKAYDRDFAPEWGLLPVEVQAVATDAEIPTEPGVRVMRIIDSDPSVPDAVAYHSRDAEGRATLVVMVDAARSEGGDFLRAISMAASHELYEAALDPEVNEAVEVPGSSKMQMREPCDPCQGDSYDVDGFAISDFVTRAYFTPEGTAPFDHVGALTAPFSCAASGYRSYSDGSQDFGACVPERKKAAILAHGRVAHARRERAEAS